MYVISNPVKRTLYRLHFIGETEVQEVIWSRAHSLIKNSLGFLTPGLLTNLKPIPFPMFQGGHYRPHTSKLTRYVHGQTL